MRAMAWEAEAETREGRAGPDRVGKMRQVEGGMRERAVRTVGW